MLPKQQVLLSTMLDGALMSSDSACKEIDAMGAHFGPSTFDYAVTGYCILCIFMHTHVLCTYTHTTDNRWFKIISHVN